MRTLLILTLVSFVLSACVGENSNKVGGGNFYVHFDDKEDLKVAEDIARFWKDQNLVSGKEQDIKLFNRKSSYELYLISDDKVEEFQLPAEHMQLLFDLQNDLNSTLKTQKPIQIVISDKNFNKIININE